MLINAERLYALESLTREESEKLHKRFPLGYVGGLKSAVLTVRVGKSLDEAVAYTEAKIKQGSCVVGDGIFLVDDYEDGFLAGLKKAKKIMEGGNG